MAGTTAIASLRQGELRIFQSARKSDADRFIGQWVARHRPDVVYLDAPLSLPGVYRGLSGCEDFFFREADREAGAMSPMFLGGLTARAMKLRADLESNYPLRVWEVYPGGLARQHRLADRGYKKKGDPRNIADWLTDQYELPRPDESEPWNWHRVDALLSLCIGLRHQAGLAQALGRPDEGIILV